MPPSTAVRYEFGLFHIDAGERLLHKGEDLIPLPPKVVTTLLVLLESAGRMVDKGVLIKAVWPDTFVEEGALARNISLLRKILEDTGDEPAYIETIPKRGYRFIAPVRTDGPESDSPKDPPVKEPGGTRLHRRRFAALTASGVLVVGVVTAVVLRDRSLPPVAPTTRSTTTLAVLPLRTIERDASQDYFADGLTEALITSLAKLGKLRVVSMASDARIHREPAAWDEILKNPSVRLVLTGTVLRSGGRVRIDVKLTNPRTRELHWANSYDREEGDLLALEAAVSEAIAGEVEVNITAGDRERMRLRKPVKAAALDAYLQGRYFWNRRTEEGLRRSLQYFQQAIAADPDYALAYSGMADAYSLLGSVGTDGMPPREAMPLANSAARKAIELDPSLAEGHVSLAYVKLSYDWDLPGAAAEFSRALALNPNSATGRHWYSHYFMAAGDLARAAEQMNEAVQLEPLSPSINIGVGWCHYYSKRYDQAIERFRSVVEIDPSLPMAHQTLGMALQQKGMFEQAIEEFRRAASFSNNSPGAVAALASAYGAAGKIAEARAELARLEELTHARYVPAVYFASVHNALGDLASALRWGWKAVDERCDYLLYLRVEPQAGQLVFHPDFLRAMRAIRR